jgi:hypothetical protein
MGMTFITCRNSYFRPTVERGFYGLDSMAATLGAPIAMKAAQFARPAVAVPGMKVKAWIRLGQRFPENCRSIKYRTTLFTLGFGYNPPVLAEALLLAFRSGTGRREEGD